MILATQTGMTWLDGAVIGLYAAGMLVIGGFYALGNRTTEDYHLGGRNMRSSSIGLSLFATLFSTITYLALPGEMINKGPVLLCYLFGLPVAYAVVAYLLIPHFMKLKTSSAYEILETRLGLGIRMIGSCIFLVTRLLWMSLITYITADKLIVTVMGWDPARTLPVAVCIGLVTLIYTSMGGLRAVVMTDVVQSLILFGAALTAIVVITVRLGGVGAWWPRTWSPTWEHQPLFSLDPRVRVTVVGSLVYMTLWWICTSGSDQMAIQRYLATRDVRAARRALLLTLGANILVNLVLAGVGLALLGFFRAHPPPGLSIVRDADKLFPYYIVHYLPPGVTGLVLAGLLAAAMSSLSSGINSACSVISADFFDRFSRRPASEQVRLRRQIYISAAVGVVTVIGSVQMMKLARGVNIMELTTRTNHVFVAPLFGLFFMALFVPFATPRGTAAGALAGWLVGGFLSFWGLLAPGSAPSFQWITLVALIVHLAVGCGVSLLEGGPRPRPAEQPGAAAVAGEVQGDPP
ncbi:MAG: sodium/solute symporter [Phycisphaerae bacterium]|jgi:SSS family solute:Na+ symporter